MSIKKNKSRKIKISLDIGTKLIYHGIGNIVVGQLISG